jgi:hypothetical protein
VLGLIRLLKRFGMLREPQHERKIVNDIKTPPFVLSLACPEPSRRVEGLGESFFSSLL